MYTPFRFLGLKTTSNLVFSRIVNNADKQTQGKTNTTSYISANFQRLFSHLL